MNEYRGFKVGDRVEITFSSAHPIKGTITSFGDRKLGGFAEPDTMDVWISETTRYDMIYLVSHDLIKKLPKYAVGDVVRRNNKQLIKCEITSVDQLCDKTYIYTLSDCGSARFSESMLITFDGFRVGDTVWTVKRGKGKVVSEIYCCTDGRSFFVRFDNDTCDRNPRDRNLIPTEAKYKEALNKAGYAFKIDVAFVQEYVAKPKNEAAERQAEKIAKIKAAGEAFYQAAKNMAAAIGRTTDQIKFPSGGVVYQCPPIPEHLIVSREPIMKFQVAPSAKFKAGDAVFYDHLCRGKKWTVDAVETYESDGLIYKIKYTIKSVADPSSSCIVNESDLRLWKETKLTHCLQYPSDNWFKSTWKQPKECHEVKYLGKICMHDTFLVTTTKGGSTALFRGEKGDDIQ